MKTVLSINTVGNGTQISLQKSNEVFYCDLPFAKHSETLFDTLEGFLIKHDTKLDDINYLGVVTGPGSFTGIRIGLSVVKTFAYVKNLPIVAENSLKVLAYNVFYKPVKTKNVCSIINAGSNQVYYQVFEITEGQLNDITPPKVDTINHFLSFVKTLKDVSFISPDEIEELKLKIQVQPFMAQSLNLAMQNCVNKKKFLANAEVQPIYLRLSQGELINVKNKDLALTKAYEGQSVVLCALDNQQDEFYQGYDVASWQKMLLDNNFVCNIIAYKGANIGLIAYKKDADAVQILRFVVDKKARNQGVAKTVLNLIMDQLFKQDVNKIMVSINKQNLSAFNLFVNNGFVKDGKTNLKNTNVNLKIEKHLG